MGRAAADPRGRTQAVVASLQGGAAGLGCVQCGGSWGPACPCPGRLTAACVPAVSVRFEAAQRKAAVV